MFNYNHHYFKSTHTHTHTYTYAHLLGNSESKPQLKSIFQESGTLTKCQPNSLRKMIKSTTIINEVIHKKPTIKSTKFCYASNIKSNQSSKHCKPSNPLALQVIKLFKFTTNQIAEVKMWFIHWTPYAAKNNMLESQNVHLILNWITMYSETNLWITAI